MCSRALGANSNAPQAPQSNSAATSATLQQLERAQSCNVARSIGRLPALDRDSKIENPYSSRYDRSATTIPVTPITHRSTFHD
jgi:hypothetical protein